MWNVYLLEIHGKEIDIILQPMPVKVVNKKYSLFLRYEFLRVKRRFSPFNKLL